MKKYLCYFSPDEDFSSVGTGEEMTSSADLSEANVEDAGTPEVDSATEGTAEVEEPQSPDMNSQFANIRRTAEKKAEERFNKRLAEIDAQFAKKFGSFTNPITGESITSYQGYLDAIDAQEKLRAENELRDKGVDPKLIDNLVQNSPAVRQANEYIAKMQAEEADRQLKAEVEEVAMLDPTIKSFNDIPKEVVVKALDRKMTLAEAYMTLNFGKTSSEKAEAIRQSAVNQIKGKQHLAPMNGVAINNNEVEIPENIKWMWEQMHPDKTPAERRKLYNKTL